MNRAGRALAWASAGLGMAAFFLPWVVTPVASDSGLPGHAIRRIEERVGRVELTVRRAGQTHTTSLASLADSLPAGLSGYAIPRFANRRDAAALVAMAQLVGLAPEALDRKSWLVYAVPAGLLALALLVSVKPGVAGKVAVICLAAAGLGYGRILSFQASALPPPLSIGIGLWLSTAAYALMALAALLLALSGRATHRSSRFR